jgi:alpha-tubulin suppressor-like RCC1 family protein
MLDTLEVRLFTVDSLGVFQTGIPFDLLPPTGFGEIVPGPTTTGVNGELVVEWVLGPTPGMQTFTAIRADIGRVIQVEAEGTGQVDPWPFQVASTGRYHTCAVDDMGTGYCWGRGQEWQLATNDTLDVDEPTALTTAITWADIAAGETHSCGLTDTDSQVYCWGEGFQTGQATGLPVPLPVMVPGGPWASITSGARHVCAVTQAGAGFCWGVNDEGRLGNAVLLATEVPTAIDGGLTWSFLSGGRAHTCGRTNDLKAYCWGEGSSGQLGNGPLVDQTAPVLVAGGFEWRSVSAGWDHSCGITVDKDAYCWGEGGVGELGYGGTQDQGSPVKVDGNQEWDKIAAGRRHTCAIDADGKLYCWGGRAAGGGTRPWLVGIGPFGSTTPAAVRHDLTFKAVQTAEYHTCAVTTDNQAYCWGNGDFGQLGVRNILDYDVPRQVFRGVILP